MARLIYDLHQDLELHVREPDLYENPRQTGYSTLRDGGPGLVIATAFPHPRDDDFFSPVTDELIERDFAAYRKQPGFAIVDTAADLPTEPGGKPRLLLHVEGLNVFDGSPAAWEKLEKWYGLGWRSLGLVWNLANPLGGGADAASGGLTDLGRKVLRWLADKRMVIDLVHMNRETFDDALAATEGPVLVSHANARALCDHRRNLDDTQLKAVAARDGIVGVTAVPDFVRADGPASLDDLVKHARYIADLIGPRHLAIGSDFGGILKGGIPGFAGTADFPGFFEAFGNAGFSEAELEDVAWRNANRVLAAQLVVDR